MNLLSQRGKRRLVKLLKNKLGAPMNVASRIRPCLRHRSGGFRPFALLKGMDSPVITPVIHDTCLIYTMGRWLEHFSAGIRRLICRCQPLKHPSHATITQEGVRKVHKHLRDAVPAFITGNSIKQKFIRFYQHSQIDSGTHQWSVWNPVDRRRSVLPSTSGSLISPSKRLTAVFP